MVVVYMATPAPKPRRWLAWRFNLANRIIYFPHRQDTVKEFLSKLRG